MTDENKIPQSQPRRTKSWIDYLVIAARILMGLIFLVFGLNGFLHFIPSKRLPDGAMAFFGALKNTGYMFPLIFATQIFAGVLLILGLFPAFALVVIAPVIVNIILFHANLSPVGYQPAIAVVVLEIFLVWAYRKSYRPMFAGRIK